MREAQPRIAPDRWSANARCLGDFDLSALPRTSFDGVDREVAARSEGWTG